MSPLKFHKSLLPVEKRRIHTPPSWGSSFDSYPSREERLTSHSHIGFARHSIQGIPACNHRNSPDYFTCRKCSLDLLPKFQPFTRWSKPTNYFESSDQNPRSWINSLFKDGNLAPSVGIPPTKPCPWSSHSSHHIRCSDDPCRFLRKHLFHGTNPKTDLKTRAS